MRDMTYAQLNEIADYKKQLRKEIRKLILMEKILYKQLMEAEDGEGQILPDDNTNNSSAK